jgi:hypothetical protein
MTSSLPKKQTFSAWVGAEEKWAQPDTIVWATTGAVSQQKTMPKPGGGLTQGHADLMQFTITSILFSTPTRGVGGAGNRN